MAVTAGAIIRAHLSVVTVFFCWQIPAPIQKPTQNETLRRSTWAWARWLRGALVAPMAWRRPTASMFNSMLDLRLGPHASACGAAALSAVAELCTGADGLAASFLFFLLPFLGSQAVVSADGKWRFADKSRD
jgi:hypothetical protein